MERRKNIKVLVACEFSGRVREAFRELGHDAWSCDILPAEDESKFHLQGDVKGYLNYDCDLMIAHPPCTHLAVSGARWFKNKILQQVDAIKFCMDLAKADVPRIAIENPISIMSTVWRKPDQIIQPWQFGHGETKATCLWLKNLPKLIPTNIVEGREQNIWLSKGKQKGDPVWKFRSRTYTGIAKAMAQQWGNLDDDAKSRV